MSEKELGEGGRGAIIPLNEFENVINKFTSEDNKNKERIQDDQLNDYCDKLDSLEKEIKLNLDLRLTKIIEWIELNINNREVLLGLKPLLKIIDYNNNIWNQAIFNNKIDDLFKKLDSKTEKKDHTCYENKCAICSEEIRQKKKLSRNLLKGWTEGDGRKIHTQKNDNSKPTEFVEKPYTVTETGKKLLGKLGVRGILNKAKEVEKESKSYFLPEGYGDSKLPEFEEADLEKDYHWSNTKNRYKICDKKNKCSECDYFFDGCGIYGQRTSCNLGRAWKEHKAEPEKDWADRIKETYTVNDLFTLIKDCEKELIEKFVSDINNSIFENLSDKIKLRNKWQGRLKK